MISRDEIRLLYVEKSGKDLRAERKVLLEKLSRLVGLLKATADMHALVND